MSEQLALFHTPRAAPLDYAEWARHCVECAADPGYYLVRDEVWAAGGLAPDGGLLCTGCLERRIGRPLAREDFPDVPINRARVEGGPS
jgi:hypothetical protein